MLPFCLLSHSLLKPIASFIHENHRVNKTTSLYSSLSFSLYTEELFEKYDCRSSAALKHVEQLQRRNQVNLRHIRVQGENDWLCLTSNLMTGSVASHRSVNHLKHTVRGGLQLSERSVLLIEAESSAAAQV